MTTLTIACKTSAAELPAGEKAFRLEPVVTDYLEEWISIFEEVNDASMAELRGHIATKPQYTRFVLLRGDSPYAQFTIERYGLGLTTWRPNFRAGLTLDEREAGRHFIAKTLPGILASEGRAFVECQLDMEDGYICGWQVALVATGFSVVSRLREWTKQLPTAETGERPAAGGLAFSFHRAPDRETLSYMAPTLVGSLDRQHQFMARFDDATLDYDAIILARRGGEVVGVCGLLADNDTTSWIKDIAVMPTERGRGIGEALLREALRRCEADGTILMRALIDEQNEPSIRLHKRCGFERQPDSIRMLYLEAEPLAAAA